ARRGQGIEFAMDKFVSLAGRKGPVLVVLVGIAPQHQFRPPLEAAGAGVLVILLEGEGGQSAGLAGSLAGGRGVTQEGGAP
ncbi:MAG: hypothetical protein LBR16_06800, partial [Treponema sp.]|nr:hypothetical protein [Treponema sp.]